MIWYYLVHDNFFVSGLDWGTIIVTNLHPIHEGTLVGRAGIVTSLAR